MCQPYDVADGPDGSVYIADYGHHRVRKIDPSGIITTVAGTGVLGFSGDGGPATTAIVGYPRAVDVGPDGSIYVAQASSSFNLIRRVRPDGIIETFAGMGAKGYSGGGLPAKASALNNPTAVSVAPDGSSHHLTRAGMPWDYEVTHTSAMGRQTKYAVRRNDAGAQVRTNTFANVSLQKQGTT